MAAKVKKDRLAAKLLQHGNRFGRQHVVFQARHSYPAYVVKYTLNPDVKLSVVKVKISAQSISVTVAGESVYKVNPRDMQQSIFFVKINFVTSKYEKGIVLDLLEVESVEESMAAYLASLTPDEIVVVTSPNLSLPSKLSPVMVNVLRTLRTIGGSLHVLDCPYALVGCNQPHLLTGLVHEDHQQPEAVVEVDLRVIRYNRDTPTANISQLHSVTYGEMIPARWQQQDKRHPNGVTWEELRNVGSQLTAAYQANRTHVVINGHTVDLSKMKVQGGPKIRCLNHKGETLPSLNR